MSPVIQEVVGRSPLAPTLSILRGAKAGRTYELLGENITIGRNSGCDLILPDEVISRTHARLRRRPDGTYLEDLKSRNGTFVNGIRLNEPIKLTDGDYIQVFELVLCYHGEGARNSGTNGPQAALKDVPADWASEDSSATGPAVNAEQTVKRNPRSGRSSAIIMTMDASWTGSERIEANAETKLQAVLEITRNLGSTLSLDHLLPRILDSAFRLFPQADHGYVLKAEDSGGLRPAVIKHHERCGVSTTIRPIARTIAKQVLSEAKAILSSDVTYDQHSAETQCVIEMEHRSMMCAPLMGPSQRPLGIIYIDTENAQHPFSADDLDVLVCIAILAGQAMEQASASEARYRAVVDAAADGILTINSQGVIESVNPAMERLFGYPARELMGEFVTRLSGEREEGSAPKPLGFFEADETETLRSTRETLGRRKDGSTFPLSLSVSELELGGERLLTGILQDITDRKQAEHDRLQAELVDAVWEQQRHFGQELHDSLGQELTGIRLLIDSLRQRLRKAQLHEAETADELGTLIRAAQNNMRRLARGLFPVEIFAHGLMSALEELAGSVRGSGQVDCSFHCEGSVDVDSNEVATHLFRIAQEAINNAIKHSGAKHVRIALIGKGSRLVLAIQDDGSGLPENVLNSASLSSGMGLRTMKYRANVVGADLTITSAQESTTSDASCGTIIRCVYQRHRQIGRVSS